MTSEGAVLTLGEALVALVSADSASLAETSALGLHVGGAELNMAVGVSRLGQQAQWLGVVGDDPMGRRVLEELRANRVGAEHASVIPGSRTGVYLRPRVSAGERELCYYRAGSAAADGLGPELWPEHLAGVGWLHLTGITAALGERARALLSTALDWASDQRVPVSFDPNYRRALWAADEAAPHLRRLAQRSDVTLLSEADACVMVGTGEPRQALDRLGQLGVLSVVLKRGGGTVFAAHGADLIAVPVVGSPDPVDTVGAGDGFDAGFVAARLAGADVESAIEVGCFVGARAVESVGEHCYPSLQDLPARLATRSGLDQQPDRSRRQEART